MNVLCRFLSWCLVCRLASALYHATEVTGQVRRYYIAAEVVIWDYYPPRPDRNITATYPQAKLWIGNEPSRIGSTYQKVRYVEYTDASFTKAKPHSPEWEHLGMLGPVLRAQVGDTFEVLFFNNADRPYTMHPHGIFYDQENEGAVAMNSDNTLKFAVYPGTYRLYEWSVPERAGPTDTETSSVVWFYHSHVREDDVNSGLLGPIIITRKDVELHPSGRPSDVDVEFFLLVAKVDEMDSNYFEANFKQYVSSSYQTEPEKSHLMADQDFKESNLMHAINFRVFDSLSGLTASVGSRIRFYLAAIGTEFHVHTFGLAGYTGVRKNQRTSFVTLLPSSHAILDFTPQVPGKVALLCEVWDHMKAGMYGHLEVTPSPLYNPGTPYESGVVHRHHIAAEEVWWDYRPDLNVSIHWTNPPTATPVGSVYKKARYVEYEDGTFTTVKERAQGWLHLGLLGPVLRARVGDMIEINFLNKATRPYNMFFHGMMYKSQSGNLSMLDNPLVGDVLSVAPQTSYLYQLYISEQVGPADGDPSCIVWAYRSVVDQTNDASLGLVGPLIVCRKDEMIAEDGRPLDVDGEAVLCASVVDENASPYLKDTWEALNQSTPLSSVIDNEDFRRSNFMHALNFRVFHTLPKIEAKVGEKVRLYVMALGREVDVHTISTVGLTGLSRSVRKDTVTLSPASFSYLDLFMDRPGEYDIICHRANHFEGGMMTTLQVSGNSSNPIVTGRTHVHYIAAEELLWDYCPNQTKFAAYARYCDGSPNDRIGSVYKKARYVEYTDDTFTVEKPRPPEWTHLCLLGPVLRAQVGDVFKIHFKNMASFPYALQAHGIFQRMEAEQHQEHRHDLAIPPGEQTLYTWFVPERAGPGPDDPSSILWIYSSNIVTDANAGLVGPIIITAKDTPINEDGRPLDLDKEFVMLFSVADENNSPNYLRVNTEMFTSPTNGVDALLHDAEFQESNMMHGINFRVFSNVPGLEAQVGDSVRVYLMGLGGQVDIHTIHSHGMSGISWGRRTDVLDLLPASFTSMNLFPDSTGHWMLHCHVHDHLKAGMIAEFNIVGPCQERISLHKIEAELLAKPLINKNMKATLAAVLIPLCLDKVLSEHLENVHNVIEETQTIDYMWQQAWIPLPEGADSRTHNFSSDPFQAMLLQSPSSQRLRELITGVGLESRVADVRVTDVVGAIVGLSDPLPVYQYSKNPGWIEAFNDCHGGVSVSFTHSNPRTGEPQREYSFPFLGKNSEVVGVITWSIKNVDVPQSCVFKVDLGTFQAQAQRLPRLDFFSRYRVAHYLARRAQDSRIVSMTQQHNYLGLNRADIYLRQNIWVSTGGYGDYFKNEIFGSNDTQYLRRMVETSLIEDNLDVVKATVLDNQGVVVATTTNSLHYWNGQTFEWLQSYQDCKGNIVTFFNPDNITLSLQDLLHGTSNLQPYAVRVSFPIVSQQTVIGVLSSDFQPSNSRPVSCKEAVTKVTTLGNRQIMLEANLQSTLVLPAKLRGQIISSLLPFSLANEYVTKSLQTRFGLQYTLNNLSELDMAWRTGRAQLKNASHMVDDTWSGQSKLHKQLQLMLEPALSRQLLQHLEAANRNLSFMTHDQFVLRADIIDIGGALLASTDLMSPTYLFQASRSWQAAFDDCQGGIFAYSCRLNQSNVGNVEDMQGLSVAVGPSNMAKEHVIEPYPLTKDRDAYLVALPLLDTLGNVQGVVAWTVADFNLIAPKTSKNLAQDFQVVGVVLAGVAALSFSVYIVLRIKWWKAGLIHDKDAANQKTHFIKQFMASMSHEIRTPLNGMFAATALMGMTDLDADQKSNLKDIQLCCQHLLSMTNNLLDLARMESGRDDELIRTPVMVRDLLEEAIQLGQRAVANTSLGYVMTPEVACHVVGDPVRLRQILVNLVNNACKFCANGDILLVCYLTPTHQLQNCTEAMFEHLIFDKGVSRVGEVALPQWSPLELPRPLEEIADEVIVSKGEESGRELSRPAEESIHLFSTINSEELSPGPAKLSPRIGGTFRRVSNYRPSSNRSTHRDDDGGQPMVEIVEIVPRKAGSDSHVNTNSQQSPRGSPTQNGNYLGQSFPSSLPEMGKLHYSHSLTLPGHKQRITPAQDVSNSWPPYLEKPSNTTTTTTTTSSSSSSAVPALSFPSSYIGGHSPLVQRSSLSSYHMDHLQLGPRNSSPFIIPTTITPLSPTTLMPPPATSSRRKLSIVKQLEGGTPPRTSVDNSLQATFGVTLQRPHTMPHTIIPIPQPDLSLADLGVKTMEWPEGIQVEIERVPDEAASMIAASARSSRKIENSRSHHESRSNPELGDSENKLKEVRSRDGTEGSLADSGGRSNSKLSESNTVSRIKAANARTPKSRSLWLSTKIKSGRKRGVTTDSYFDHQEPSVSQAVPTGRERSVLSIALSSRKRLESQSDDQKTSKKRYRATWSLVFAVADSGIGIKKEVQERMFVPFSQGQHSKSEFGGSGLGLAVSKLLAERMKGSLSVKSKFRTGSLFSLAIPYEPLVDTKELPKRPLPLQYSKRPDGRPRLAFLSGRSELIAGVFTELARAMNCDVNKVTTQTLRRLADKRLAAGGEAQGSSEEPIKEDAATEYDLLVLDLGSNTRQKDLDALIPLMKDLDLPVAVLRNAPSFEINGLSMGAQKAGNDKLSMHGLEEADIKHRVIYKPLRWRLVQKKMRNLLDMEDEDEEEVEGEGEEEEEADEETTAVEEDLNDTPEQLCIKLPGLTQLTPEPSPHIQNPAPALSDFASAFPSNKQRSPSSQSTTSPLANTTSLSDLNSRVRNSSSPLAQPSSLVSFHEHNNRSSHNPLRSNELGQPTLVHSAPSSAQSSPMGSPRQLHLPVLAPSSSHSSSNHSSLPSSSLVSQSSLPPSGPNGREQLNTSTSALSAEQTSQRKGGEPSHRRMSKRSMSVDSLPITPIPPAWLQPHARGSLEKALIQSVLDTPTHRRSGSPSDSSLPRLSPVKPDEETAAVHGHRVQAVVRDHNRSVTRSRAWHSSPCKYRTIKSGPHSEGDSSLDPELPSSVSPRCDEDQAAHGLEKDSPPDGELERSSKEITDDSSRRIGREEQRSSRGNSREEGGAGAAGAAGGGVAGAAAGGAGLTSVGQEGGASPNQDNHRERRLRTKGRRPSLLDALRSEVTSESEDSSLNISSRTSTPSSKSRSRPASKPTSPFDALRASDTSKPTSPLPPLRGLDTSKPTSLLPPLRALDTDPEEKKARKRESSPGLTRENSATSVHGSRTDLHSISTAERSSTTELPGGSYSSPNKGRRKKAKSKKPTKSLRILVVDDNALNRKLLTGILQKMGYTDITNAVNGKVAVDLVLKEDRSSPVPEGCNFDLVFMDLQMPVMDGWQATAEITKAMKGKKGPFICALTASTLQKDHEECLSQGFHHFISKPFTVKDLSVVLDGLNTPPT